MLPTKAEDRMITITPIKKISTSDKNLLEGDIVTFQDINSKKTLEGIIKTITPNGFMGKQASLLISNIHYTNSNNNYFGQINSMNNQNVNPSSISSGTGIQPTGNNQNGVSLVGQTNASEQTIVPDMDMNKPKKKFPLSVREMVLIGIALIGIVVVIIIYT